jgi:t-SNARE complex subunit (syntaxin)
MPAVPSPSPRSGGYVKFSDKLTASLQDIERIIAEHKDMIDAIQEVAINLTDAMGSLHALTVKYAGIANSILDVLLPIAKTMPLIPKNVTDLLVNLEAITQKIIDSSDKTAKTIAEVNSGLKSGDAAKLKGHAEEIKNMTQALASILPGK